MNIQNRKWITWVAAAVATVACGPALAQGAVAAEYRWLTFAVFAAIIGLTILTQGLVGLILRGQAFM